MAKPELLPVSNITPLFIQGYEHYLPTAFDESMTLLQRVNKVVQELWRIGELTNEMIDKWNEVIKWVIGEGLETLILATLTQWLKDGTLKTIISEGLLTDLQNQIKTNKTNIDNLTKSLTDVVEEFNNMTQDLANLKKFVELFERIGSDSLQLNGSLYLKNDTNLFGRTANGDYVNIGTMQQNDIMQYGDEKTPVMWFIAMNYFSFRSKGNPTYQQIDDNMKSVGPGRTMLHQGNSTYHLWTLSSGEQELLEDVDNTITILNNVNTCFPPGAYNGREYTIERAGMYHYNTIVKLKENTIEGQGLIRVTVNINRNGQNIRSDMCDLHYNAALYGSPFLSGSFQYRHSKGDVVRITLKPLNENVTIEEGSRLAIYQLGDTIQE